MENPGFRCTLFPKFVSLTQNLIADLFEKSVMTMNEHIRNIYEEKELDPETTIRKFRIVQMEGGIMVRFVMERNPDSARIECTIIEQAPEKILCSGNCGFTVPTICHDTFCGSINRVLTKVLT
jgi:hypothetical protein